ncbi:MAG TPA: GyrI-like domain-containing protein [Streptosporangiaceae bacterium]|nr:GyrI-like domain-containing protein [Streptosporangiaceae bacterium]
MPATPQVSERPAQAYVAVRANVAMEQLPGLADRLGEVFGWLAERDIAPAGPPFFRYHIIDMERQLTVEAGVPVVTAVEGDSSVTAGVLPAGRYATSIHVGHYDGLIGAVDDLLRWAEGQGLEWDKSDAEDGEHWGCRLEIYRTDPAEQPDPATWETQLAFRLK